MNRKMVGEKIQEYQGEAQQKAHWEVSTGSSATICDQAIAHYTVSTSQRVQRGKGS